MNNRAGHYKSNLSGEMAYKSFVPNPLPPVSPIELTEDIVQMWNYSYLCMCVKRH